MSPKKLATRNKTLSCSQDEIAQLSSELLTLTKTANLDAILNKIINQNVQNVVQYLPRSFVDLLILDPPYNLTKN
ncbi:MAG: hypothetical protein LBQ66_13780, partial [Planctomycetaceae bacterium]|nr:hypothetical protein [Planctomycetaceae bacterium]